MKSVKNPVARLFGSSAVIIGSVCYAAATGDAFSTTPKIIGSGLEILNTVAPEIFGGAFDEHFIKKNSRDDILNNGDLTRAIGKAIFDLCGQEADETSNAGDKKSLQILSEIKPESWEDLVLGGSYEEGYGLSFSDIDLDKLSSEKSTEHFQAKEGGIDNIKILSAEEWKEIIETLCDKKHCPLSDKAKKRISDKLHNQFSKTLRKTLIEDFTNDGKAYASMQFRILSEILYYTKQNYELNDNILSIVVDTNKRVDELINKSPNHYSPENFEKWGNIFKDFELTKQTIEKTYQNTEDIKGTLTEHGEQLKNILANQQKCEIIQPKGFVNPPREPNDFFVEQSDIFARLDEHLGKYHIGYLHGTHGLGKTTTVCEYGFSRANDYKFVFYVLAADNNTIINEMAQLADRYIKGIGAEDKPEQKALKLKYFLEENSPWEKESKNWLIVFDNLESKEPIEKYFPKNGKGDILYTCNEKLYVGNDREVDFEEFIQTEAELFLYQKVNEKKDAAHRDIPADELKEIQKVTEILGKIPLSLNIAGSYIRETGVSYDDYVELIKVNINKHLKYKDGHKQHQNETAFDAFSISLDKIKEFDIDDEDGETVAKLAETFLNLCSFCAPEDIPEELIEKTLFNIVETKDSATPPKVLFRETVGLLKKFDLIKEKQKPFRYKEKFDEPQTLEDGTKAHWAERETVINVFDTYRILQNILSVKLEDETKKILLEKLIGVFNNLLPDLEFTTWEIYGEFVLQALPIIEKAKSLSISNFESWRICNGAGFYLKEISQYTRAENFYICGKILAEETYGRDHKITATSYNNLAELYRIQSRYKESEPLFQKALLIKKNIFGVNHPDTATSYNNLAVIYNSQGEYPKAETHYRKALSIRENVLGINHLDTAVSYNNLAYFYHSQSKYNKAEPLYLKALPVYEAILGINNPKMAVVYNNLASLYCSQDKYEEAELLFQKTLSIYENSLGINHSSTARVYNNFGSLRYKQNKFSEALKLFKQALASWQNVLPENHPDIKMAESWIEMTKNVISKKETKKTKRMSENIKEIIEKISYYDGTFPKEELQFLIDNKEESTTFLLDAVRNSEEVLEKLLRGEDYFLPYYALLLLAQFREQKAYPIVYEIFSGNAKKVDNAFGDFTTEDLPEVLASVSGGDTSLIEKLIEDEKVYEFVRSAAIDSWLFLLKAGLKTRDEVIAYFRKLFEMPAEEGDFIRGALIWNCLNIKATELMPEIEKSFAENKVELMLMGDWDEVQKLMAEEKPDFLDASSNRYNLVDDMISMVEKWVCFRDPQSYMEDSEPSFLPMQDLEINQSPAWDSRYDGTFQRETAKVGKNEPCPCGSGRKYKKCCLN